MAGALFGLVACGGHTPPDRPLHPYRFTMRSFQDVRSEKPTVLKDINTRAMITQLLDGTNGSLFGGQRGELVVTLENYRRTSTQQVRDSYIDLGLDLKAYDRNNRLIAQGAFDCHAAVDDLPTNALDASAHIWEDLRGGDSRKLLWQQLDTMCTRQIADMFNQRILEMGNAQ